MLTFALPEFSGRMGAGRADITPPAGIYARNWGAARHDVSEGVHRPLVVTALALDAGSRDRPFLLVAVDGAWWKSAADEWRVRSGLFDELSLDPARVIVNLSHTHSGPSLSTRDSEKPGGGLVPQYLARLRAAVVEAARQALERRQPATLTWNYGKCLLARNRGLQEAGGRYLCGFNPSAAGDDTLLAGRVTDSGGKTIAVVVNYACHGTALGWDNRLVSPDFPGAMRDTIESRTGGLALFLQGASGDLAPREQYAADPAVADTHGRQLGYAVLASLEDMLPPETALEMRGAVESGAVLADWRRVPRPASRDADAVCRKVEVPLQDWPTVRQLDEAIAACDDRVLAERLRRKRESRIAVGDGNSASVPVWVWRLGDAFVVAQPEEAFSALQIELRRRFPRFAVAALNLANGGEAGYLPPAGHYGLDRYEVWQTPYGRGCHERLVEGAAEIIQELIDHKESTTP